jgi:hypothetical protein
MIVGILWAAVLVGALLAAVPGGVLGVVLRHAPARTLRWIGLVHVSLSAVQVALGIGYTIEQRAARFDEGFNCQPVDAHAQHLADMTLKVILVLGFTLVAVAFALRVAVGGDRFPDGQRPGLARVAFAAAIAVVVGCVVLTKWAGVEYCDHS